MQTFEKNYLISMKNDLIVNFLGIDWSISIDDDK